MNSTRSELPTAGVAENPSYTSRFFADTALGSLTSARLVLGKLFEIYRPNSVVDVGCGSGAWLAAAEELGATKLVGFDGPWVDPSALLSKHIAFSPVNLEARFAPPERFDLCISVEVAEHVSLSSASGFVKNLCGASDLVLFSAAIPQQGGVMHINEQWQSYWATLFQNEGYACYDLFRPQLWADQRVESWYRQNALLYIKHLHPIAEKARERSMRSGPLDIVHPDIYKGNLDNYMKAVEDPTLKLCWQLLVRWWKKRLKRLSGR